MSDRLYRAHPTLTWPLTASQLSAINDEFEKIYRLLRSGTVAGSGSGTAVLTPTGVTAGSYGSASRTITETVNDKGLLTAASDQDIAIDTSQITTGTIADARLPASGVTANTYGDSTHVAQVTVDAKGRITAASNVGLATVAGAITASLYNSTDQTLTHGTEATLAFDSEDADASGMHDTVTNNSRLTIPSAGAGDYAFTARVKFAVAFAGVVHLRFYKNGSLVTENTSPGGDLSSGNEYHQASALLTGLIATDYVEVKALVELAAGSGTIATKSGTGNTQFQVMQAVLAVSPLTPGLVLLEQHTASASASLNFTTAISATYDEYWIELLNLIPATDGVDFRLRMSTDGGSTYDSGTNYRYNTLAGGGGTALDAATSAAFIAVTYIGTAHVDSGSNFGISGSLRLFNPSSASAWKTVLGQVHYMSNEGTPALVQALVNGIYKSTTAVNAFQFLFSSGNIASGTIRVYGVRKS